MDHGLGQKTVLPRGDRFFSQRVEIVDVGRNGIDRNDASGRSGDQAEIARQPKWTVKAAVAAIARGAERGGKVFGAPHHSPQPRAHILEVEQFHHRPRRLGGDRDDACGALLDPGRSLERIKVQRKLVDVGSARAFRQHDAVGPSRHHGGEIAERHIGIERVDPDKDFLVRIALIEHAARDAARHHLLLRRDGILEVENQGIGRGLLRALELPWAIAGNEQE